MKIQIIDLKTDTLVFSETFEGRKTFEIRYNDRDFKVGDILVLNETVYSGAEMKRGQPLEFTERTCSVKVTHILDGGYGLAKGWVVMSTELMELDK